MPSVIEKGCLDVAAKQDQHAIAGLVLVHQVLPTSEPAKAAELQEVGAIRIRKQLDERAALNRSRCGLAGLAHCDSSGQRWIRGRIQCRCLGSLSVAPRPQDRRWVSA